MAAIKRILMIVPVPVPAFALPGFASQIPPELIRPDIAIDFVGCRNGANLLDSPYEQTLADTWVLEAGARAEEQGYAAVCINSMSDSGLAALRSRLSIPVVGPGRSSFFLAADLGKKFSVLTMWKRWHSLYEKLALETGLLHGLSGPLPPAAIHQLKDHVAREQAAIRAADAGERSWLLGDFHVCLAECAGNSLLADILKDLTARTTLIATLYQSTHAAGASCAEHAEIVAALEAGDNQAQAGQDAVQLMTVHSAKGLEFDAVFITGMEEGLFPHENSMNDFDGLEEERRLMYVAITRARKRLYLSHSQTRMLHGQTRYNLKSRFFDELPEHTLKWITPARSAFADAMPSRRDAWQNNNGWQNNAWGGGAATAVAPKPVPQRAAPVTSGPNAWVRSGVQVFHAKFGEGAVVSIEGVGDDARAQVNFPRHGTKWLALSVAKLTQV